MIWKNLCIAAIVLAGIPAARADVTLFLEEPFGTFGDMNPTGHAAVYLSRICADSGLKLRRCRVGEPGVVISRYHRVAGYDWIAIPVIPYLYAVDRAEEVPDAVDANGVAALRDTYRREHLEAFAPDEADGSAPSGDWIQLVGAAYDRTIYTFGVQTTEAQDDKFIRAFNSGPNTNRFNLLFHNCADFARQAINFYYPKTIHRSLVADMGIMTPKQAAKCMVHFTKRHPGLQASSFVISQVAGTVPRSTAVRGVLESLTRSKKYVVPLMSLAVLHPYFGGSLAVAWVEGNHFNPRRVVESSDPPVQPGMVAWELQSNRGAGAAQ